MKSKEKQLIIDKIRIKQAEAAANMSNCVKHSVGCVITNSDNRIIGEGYNGTPENHENCDEVFPFLKGYEAEIEEYQESVLEAVSVSKKDMLCGELGDLREIVKGLHEDHHKWSAKHEIHAEMNALMYSNHAERSNGTLYTTHFPCENCAKSICTSGVSRVVYKHDYARSDPKLTKALLKQSGIRLVKIEEDLCLD